MLYIWLVHHVKESKNWEERKEQVNPSVLGLKLASTLCNFQHQDSITIEQFAEEKTEMAFPALVTGLVLGWSGQCTHTGPLVGAPGQQ